MTLKESLLARNHRLILLNSLFTVASNIGMLQSEKNRLVSAVNIIRSRIFEAFGPNIEPSGTPHVTDEKS